MLALKYVKELTSVAILQWFRRASYPSTEVTRNRANFEANQQTPVTPVWWDAQN